MSGRFVRLKVSDRDSEARARFDRERGQLRTSFDELSPRRHGAAPCARCATRCAPPARATARCAARPLLAGMSNDHRPDPPQPILQPPSFQSAQTTSQTNACYCLLFHSLAAVAARASTAAVLLERQCALSARLMQSRAQAHREQETSENRPSSEYYPIEM